MKITVYIMIVIFLASSLTAYGETLKDTPKKDMIEAQQAETQEVMEDADAAKPDVEARPAVTTKHKKHSTQSHKGEMIKHNKKETHKAIKDAETANKPIADVLPAAKNAY